MADVDIITIPPGLLYEARRGTAHEICLAAEELHHSAVVLYGHESDDLQNPAFDSFWMPAEALKALISLAQALDLFEGTDVTRIGGEHRRAFSRALKGRCDERHDTPTRPEAVDTIVALEAFQESAGYRIEETT